MTNAKNNDELKDLQIEMIDRFGLLPDATKNLFAVTQLKLFSEKIGIGSRNIINSETNNNQQVNKFPQIKVLLVGVCCREGFVTLPELLVGCYLFLN
jgi:transcription-repair coupling factor (superfamily II helicase)